MIYEGFLAVKAILENDQRLVDRLFVIEDKYSKQINYCRALAHQRKIPIIIASAEEIDLMTQGKTHGGILIEAQPRQLPKVLPDLLGNWAFIEGVEDPYNLAIIMRTLYCAGYNGLITNQRHLSHVDHILVKSSGGASEKLPWFQVEDAEQTLNKLKVLGHQIIVTHRGEQSQPYYVIDFIQPHVLCIGGEMRGLSKPVLKTADLWCTIPYPNTEARLSLNAVSALAVLSFEKERQREKQREI